MSALEEYKAQKKFYVGIDSDGCVFDSMEIKHKECFIPNIIKTWNLQPVSKFARDAAEFVNLYSKWRGVNRFPGLIMVFDLLKDWPDAMERNPEFTDYALFKEWVESGDKLSNAALQAKIDVTGDVVLKKAMEWSLAVNKSISDICNGVPPFPYLVDSLKKMQAQADLVVVSSTPIEALEKEWQEHDIKQYVRLIAGQELGNKKEVLAATAVPHYPKENILMIGDAPGDENAAKANGLSFFPIVPGKEKDSWRLFFEEAFDKFTAGTYKGNYETQLASDFHKVLPDSPPWKN
jgi:phosphoglycolate phosphatase-like HAD superfamily hydrolase